MFILLHHFLIVDFLLQVKRLETLLNKCKDTIRSNKEKSTQMMSEKEAIQKQLETQTKEIQQLKVSQITFLSFLYLSERNIVKDW